MIEGKRWENRTKGVHYHHGNLIMDNLSFLRLWSIGFLTFYLRQDIRQMIGR